MQKTRHTHILVNLIMCCGEPGYIPFYWNGQLVWTPALGLYFCEDLCRDVHVTSNVELRNYVISRQIVERRVTSDCYINIVSSLDC